MREKLIELLRDWEADIADTTFDRIADHLLANGVIVLPCKVGDTVWDISKGRVIELKIMHIEVYENGIVLQYGRDECEVFPTRFIGKTVFLTREEAEAALKEEQK